MVLAINDAIASIHNNSDIPPTKLKLYQETTPRNAFDGLEDTSFYWYSPDPVDWFQVALDDISHILIVTVLIDRTVPIYVNNIEIDIGVGTTKYDSRDSQESPDKQLYNCGKLRSSLIHKEKIATFCTHPVVGQYVVFSPSISGPSINLYEIEIYGNPG